LDSAGEDTHVDPAMVATIRSTLFQPKLWKLISENYAQDENWSEIYKELKDTKRIVNDEEKIAQQKIQQGHYSLMDDLIVELDRPNRVCVPYTPEILRLIMVVLHDSVVGGHLGVDKTLDRFNENFYMVNASRHIRAYIRSCDSCQRIKARNTQPAGLLEPLQVPEGRWTSISMDWITHLPKTKEGFDSIVVFVDRFTKRAHFAECKMSDTAQDLAMIFLREIVRHHGIPLSIVSDRDPKLTSSFWKEVCTLLQVQQRMSTAMHPQTDGQTERMNRTLEEMLRHYTSFHADDWNAY
jgi:hypothetical protein